MLPTILLLLLSFVMILAGAYAFTNAVEWAGVRLGLGHGAVGSVLAAVATALPESTIPVIAILSGEESGQIAIGAIVGAPFLLATLGMVVVGATAVLTRSRRETGTRLRLHRRSTVRDLAVFLVLLAVALVLGVVDAGMAVNVAVAVGFVVAYGIHVWRTVAHGGEADEEEELTALFFDPSKHDPPNNFQITVQVVLSLALIIGGAQLFVTEIEHLATSLGIAALVLALAVAPLASELPEKLNSVLWVRQAKDTLAVGNVTGAMVYQSMLPVAVGLAFTPWQLTGPAVAAALAALAGGALAVAVVLRGGRLRMPYVGTWFALYGGAVGFILVAQ
jgi:cation:H+ antiporter